MTLSDPLPPQPRRTPTGSTASSSDLEAVLVCIGHGLNELGPEHIRAANDLLDSGQIRDPAAGEVVWQPEEKANYCVIVLGGRCALQGRGGTIIEELAPGSLTGFLFMFSLGGQSTTRDTAFVVGPKGARLLVLSRDAVLNMSTEKPHAERTLRLAWMSRMSVEYRQWIRHGVAVSAARGSDTTSLYQLPQMP